MTTHVTVLRWAVRAVLALGVAASVVANVLHARDNPISQAIAAWPPLALLITVELVTRIPVYHRALGVIRILATAAIAGIAAWISYHHMVAVVARYGEVGSVPYLLPVSVDGLIVVASVSLIELAGGAREQRAHASLAGPAATPEPEPRVPDHAPEPVAERDTGWPKEQKHPIGGLGDDPRDVYRVPEDDDVPEVGDDGAATELAVDLVPLLPAARVAREELTREGAALTRDALARKLRRNGASIRNDRVSDLLAALRADAAPVNGNRPKALQ